MVSTVDTAVMLPSAATKSPSVSTPLLALDVIFRDIIHVCMHTHV